MKTRTQFRPRTAPYVIERLGPDDHAEVLGHLLALDAADRWLRFGMASDAASVRRYADGIAYETSVVLGARGPDGALVGLAHVAITNRVADLGLSVSAGARRDGLARELASAALSEAAREGAREFRFDFAADNPAMRRLADRLGMGVSRDGSEFVASRRLAGPRSPALRGDRPAAE